MICIRFPELVEATLVKKKKSAWKAGTKLRIYYLAEKIIRRKKMGVEIVACRNKIRKRLKGTQETG